ncbi:MAG TPA: hypothetical protein VHQ89_13330 [Gaiellaceae bacterium]|jgi:hypothetical protein|nr:hypothetical protein [Gaiellaceae bacterium]
MTISEYLLNAALVLVVLRQLRGKRLAGAALYVPLAICAYVGYTYLHSIPTSGNDLALVLIGSAAGITLGTLCGLFTLVYPDHDGIPFARATGIAAVLWVLGIGSRIAFSLYAQHGGGSTIEHFTIAHSLTMSAWVAGFVLMAILEAVSRTAVLLVRARRLPGATGAIISAT